MVPAGSGVEISQARLKWKVWNMAGGHLGSGARAAGRKRATSVPREPEGESQGRGRCGDAAGGPGPGLHRSRGSAPPVPQKSPQPSSAQPKPRFDFLYIEELSLSNQP